MKGRLLWMGPILVTLLAMACFRPTEPTEPPFRTEPCPALPSKVSEPTQAQAQALETLPIIPADTQGGIADFIVRVGHLRWAYEYPATDKPTRSECPWLFFEWEFRRTTAEEARRAWFFWWFSETFPATLEIRLYLAKVRTAGVFVEPDVIEACEVWDPNPNRTGEVGEGKRCRHFAHVRPEWGPRWLVVFAIRQGVTWWLIFPIPFKDSDPVARVEVPSLPSR
jgi:hypothetical protein